MPSLLSSLLFTALVLGRAVCCAGRAEPSTRRAGAPPRRPLLVPAQELVRDVSACTSLTVFSALSSLTTLSCPLEKSTESTTLARNIMHSIMVQLILYPFL